MRIANLDKSVGLRKSAQTPDSSSYMKKVLITNKQQGFSLITAIFLLVVLATLMGYMVSLRVVQQQMVVMSVQGARALQAARAGLEYGIYKALNGSSCVPGTDTTETVTFLPAEPALEKFSVSVTCTATVHTEGVASAFNFYTLTALSSSGTFAQGSAANPDYVSRQIRVTVSTAPP